MMPDGVADFAIVAYPAFVANFGGVGWLRRLNWSIGVMESIKPVSKKTSLSIKDITIIADSCDMMLKEAEYR
jgi:hypothetical protein